MDPRGEGLLLPFSLTLLLGRVEARAWRVPPECGNADWEGVRRLHVPELDRRLDRRRVPRSARSVVPARRITGQCQRSAHT